MALWSVDLTTEDGALGAAQLGSMACLISAGFSGFYLLVVAGVIGTSNESIANPFTWALLGQLIVFGVAAFLLRSGKGLIPAIGAALLLALEVLGKFISNPISIGMIFSVILLILTINGVRGANALRKGIVNEDETAEIFS
jgi:hypothetical protein